MVSFLRNLIINYTRKMVSFNADIARGQKNSFSSKFSKIRGGGFRSIRGVKYFRRLIIVVLVVICGFSQFPVGDWNAARAAFRPSPRECGDNLRQYIYINRSRAKECLRGHYLAPCVLKYHFGAVQVGAGGVQERVPPRDHDKTVVRFAVSESP